MTMIWQMQLFVGSYYKNTGMLGAYDLGGKAYFIANVVNLDNYEGTQLVIDIDFESRESPELMYLRVKYGQHYSTIYWEFVVHAIWTSNIW